MIPYSEYRDDSGYADDALLVRCNERRSLGKVVCNRHVPCASYVFPDRIFRTPYRFRNTGLLYPVEGQRVKACTQEVTRTLVDLPYYVSFVPYGEEGYSPGVCRLLRQSAYDVRVVQVK